MATKSTQDYIKMMEEQFSKLPPLPKNVNEIIVKIMPWIALVFGVLGVLASLALFGLSSFIVPISAITGGIGQATGITFGAILALVSSVLLLAAFPGTNQHKMSGWTLLFYSEVVNTLGSIVTLNVTGVIFALLGFYILFQIKHYYK